MKIKIHLVDDHNLFDNKTDFLNLKPLMVEEYVKLKTAKDRIKLSETIFDFKYFSRVDDAIAYYDENGETSFPDLIIIDLSFDGLHNTGHSQPFLFTWGVDLAEYANRMFPKSPKIILTGQSNNEDVVKQLQKRNVTIDSLDCVLKGHSFHFKQRFSTLLQKRAKSLFDFLNENQRAKLWRKIKKSVDLRKDRDVSTLNFGLRKVSLRNILWGYGDIETMTVNEVSRIVADILQGLGKDIKFSSEWKKGYVQTMLKEYQDGDEHQDTKKTIDVKAFNLLLEILQVRQHYIEDSNEEEITLYKNFIKQLCVTCKDDIEKQNIFEQKMIGRRVVIGFCSLFENGDKKFNLNILCSLLKRGITDDENNSAPIDIGNIINTALGLMSKGGRVIRNRQTMLLEEEEWYRNIGKYAVGVRGFLDKYSVKSYDPLHNDYFIDVDDVLNVVRNIRTVSLRKYPAFINHMKETIDDHNKHLIPVMEHLLGFQFE